MRIAQPTWFDAERGVGCQFDRAADGAVRCLPGTTDAPEARVDSFYADSLCEGPAAELALFEDRCGSGREPTHVRRSTDGGFRVYSIGEPFRDVRYRVSGGFCSTVESFQRVYTIGPELSPGSFVSGAEEVEQ